MTLTPGFDGYAARIRDSFARMTFMQTMGMKLTHIAPGEIDVVMAHDQKYCQQHGFLHGGAASTGMDTVCGFSALTLVSEDAGVLTVETKTNFLSPAKGDRFRFEGRVIKPGRTLIFTEATTFGIVGDQEKLVSTMTCTMMCITGRDEVKG
ncbi:MAG: PaaI family thioesterase [Pseudomonadota bacterium]